MKKADIKPGVVYAQWSGKIYDHPQPVVFLNAPKDGQLYVERDSYTRKGAAFTKASEGAKPTRSPGWRGRTTGYPAVMFDGIHPLRESPDALLSFTLAEFEKAGEAYGNGRRLVLVASLGRISGTWEQAVTDFTAMNSARNEKMAREEAEREDSRRRAAHVLAALHGGGIKTGFIPEFGKIVDIPLPLAEAEKLIALLTEHKSED